MSQATADIRDDDVVEVIRLDKKRIGRLQRLLDIEGSGAVLGTLTTLPSFDEMMEKFEQWRTDADKWTAHIAGASDSKAIQLSHSVAIGRGINPLVANARRRAGRQQSLELSHSTPIDTNLLLADAKRRAAQAAG